MTKEERIIRSQFEQLFRDHFTALCYFARKYLGDPDASKEVVHGVFIRIWEKRGEFDWGKPAKSYLFTSVYNRCMNFIRDNKKFVTQDPVEIYQDVADPSSIAASMEAAELEDRIRLALKKLPEKCREIFELNRFEGKKYNEIAEFLDISVKTVETQISRALKILKEELKDYIYIFLLFLIKNINQL